MTIKYFILLFSILLYLQSNAQFLEQETILPEFTNAVFPGGEKARVEFLKKNVIYPKSAKEEGIQGKVYINFTVDKVGTLKDFKLKRGVHPLLDIEALRVMETMPQFTPASRNGKPVSISYTTYINFSLK
jgi:TonB family protein